MVENIGQIGQSFFHEDHGQDQVTLENIQSFDVYKQAREHIQVAEHDGKTGGEVVLSRNMQCEQAERQRLPWEGKLG